VVYHIVNYVAVNIDDDDDDAFGSRVVMQERGGALRRLLECVLADSVSSTFTC
jgi:hypothetical protein